MQLTAAAWSRPPPAENVSVPFSYGGDDATPQRRTITLACAKAGPHWRKGLPLTESPAVELVPFPIGSEVPPGPLPPAQGYSKTPRGRRRRLLPFEQHEVRLLNGTHLALAEATNLRYLLSLSIDDLLYAWRRNAGQAQPPGARPLRGWEHPGSELRGHVLGHWLTASALSWATTHDAQMKERMDTVVDVLADCQRENGYLSAFPQSFLDRVERLKPVWAPYYTLHKLLSGLLDQHEIGGSAVALRVALQLAHYIQRRVANVVATQGLDHHWQTLNKEFGGLNDVLWKLHGHERDAMTAGGELRLRATASHFDRPCLLGPLAARQDTLTQMHANTQLPVLQGAHSRYEATGDATFRQLASFFVSLLLRTRTFASGGSSIGEYWPAANRLGELVSAGEGTTQESCSTHNMMRLVRGLLMTAPDDGEALEHAEYHERALFNSVLGTQRGESPGEMLYWLPLGAGVSKMDRRHPQHADGQQHGWSIPHGDFWCCVGSGIEAFARLADSTFFQLPRSSPPGAHVAAPTLYVMQPLIASHLEWRAARLNVTMRVDEPGSLPADRPLQVQLRVAPHSSSGGGVSDGIAAGELTIKLRLPRWALETTTAGGVAAWISSGTEPSSPIELPLPPSQSASFVEVTRSWKATERLTLSLPQPLYTEPLADSRPRYRSLHAIFCGPLLLAGLTYGERTLVADPTKPSSWMQPVPPSATAQLRSLMVVPQARAGGRKYVAAGPRGVEVVAGALPAASTHGAPDATWRLLCHPYPEDCHRSNAVAFELFSEPGAFLGVTSGVPEGASAAEGPRVEVLRSSDRGGHAPPAAARFRPLGRSDAVLPVGTEVSLVPELTNGMLLCAGSADAGAATGGHLMVQREGGDPPQHCSFRLGPPAASYPKLSMWARPAGGGRGFLFYPLKDIVDEAYSVYFHVVVDAASAPRECSVLRDPWRDYDADSPPVPAASRELARKVLGVKAARWSNVKGLEFGAQGVLKTPWSEGSWGVLPDRPGVLFADFGGAQHELTFERWPSFTSMRCSDGEALSGAMLLD
jgi:DUF1680 family protein